MSSPHEEHVMKERLLILGLTMHVNALTTKCMPLNLRSKLFNILFIDVQTICRQSEHCCTEV